MGKIQDSHVGASLEIIAAIAPKVSADRVVGAICEHAGITPGALRKRRDREVISLRWAAYYLLRKGGYSYPEIATMFVHDHATVIHGVQLLEAALGKSTPESKVPRADDLQGILAFTESRHALQIDEASRPGITEYLDRRHEGCAIASSPLLLANYAMLFLYLRGTVAIQLRDGTERKIGRDLIGNIRPVVERSGDLTTLSPSSCQMQRRERTGANDRRLMLIYHSTNRQVPWGTFVDSTASDPVIVEYFGRPIKYYGDVCEPKAEFSRKR